MISAPADHTRGGNDLNDIEKLTAWFNSQVGVREQGENNVKYNTDYYGAPVSGAAYPWCAAFIWDGFRECGLSALFCGGEKTAYCPYVVNYAKTHGQWVTGGYKPGDLILYDWGKDGQADHIGFCTAVSGDVLTTVEGNVGEAVKRLTRRAAEVMGAYRPKYQDAPSGEDAPPTPQGESAKDTAPYPGAVENEDYYVTKWGDTLWGIAEEFLGNGYLHPLLTQLNGVTAETLKPGMVLLLHPEDEGEEDDPFPEEEAPSGSYMIALKVLKRGDRGSTVKRAQQLLISSGYELPEYGDDGIFGAETEEAVKRCQRDNDLPRHGAIDKNTMLRLLGM